MAFGITTKAATDTNAVNCPSGAPLREERAYPRDHEPPGPRRSRGGRGLPQAAGEGGVPEGGLPGPLGGAAQGRAAVAAAAPRVAPLLQGRIDSFTRAVAHSLAQLILLICCFA